MKELLLELTDAAVMRMLDLMKDKNNLHLKLRIGIFGGGCGGFQYNFVLDEIVQINDYVIEKDGVVVLVDSMSLEYLKGGSIDYYEGLEGSWFTFINPNAKTTCSCGSSFSV